MRIVVDINHPAHVHYFKNFIWEMEKRGHAILITASEKDISYRLLDAYGFSYVKLGNYGNSILKKIVNLPLLDFRMYQAVKKFNPDLFLGFGSIRAAHVATVLKKYCINLDDSEPSPLEHLLYVPFTDVILTPHTFRKSFGKKQIHFKGYIELAYLHPNYFSPDPEVLKKFGEDISSKYVIMRFVAWHAFHDIGKRGFSLEEKITLVKEIEKSASIYISSEMPLPKQLEKYRLKSSPEHIHHLLYYSQMLVGDSQTMTTEAALLGTPVVRCNSFVGKNDMGNFLELEKKYGLIFNYYEPEDAIAKAVELIHQPNVKQIWMKKRENFMRDNIDVTTFLMKFIEGYPDLTSVLQRELKS